MLGRFLESSGDKEGFKVPGSETTCRSQLDLRDKDIIRFVKKSKREYKSENP